MSDLTLNGTLNMCFDSKASLKRLHKWIDTYPTKKMRKKLNADILNKIGKVLYLLTQIKFKCSWVKSNINSEP